MAPPRKHHSRWFTTSDMRAINLDLVTDFRLIREGDILQRAVLYLVAADRVTTGSIIIYGDDVSKLLDKLE